MSKHVLILPTPEDGDKRFEFDTADQVSIDAAMAKYEELMKTGHRAFKPGENGQPGEMLRKFDPTNEKTLFFKQSQGG